jgi:hypothetical protein
MIIGILLFVVFAFFLTQAIFETIWGVCLIINGLFWHTIAYLLFALAFLIRTCERIVRLFRKPQPEPVKFSLGRALTNHFAGIR